MPMALASPGRRILLGAACVLFAAFYLYWAGRTFLASRLGEQERRPALERAVQLEPWNARYRHRLGMYLLFADQDVSGALEHLRAAVQLNPHEAGYWLDLATANQVAGNQAEQRRAIEQAISVEPTTPTVAWEAANFFLVQGDTQAALRQFRVVLEHDPNAAFQALELCWRVTGNAELLLDQVLPPRADVHFVLLDLMALKNKEQAARLVWSRLLALKQRIDPKRVLPYLQYLLDNRRADLASEVWRQLPALSPEVAAYIPDDNLVVNGGFEQEILNYGFDWRSDPRPNVRVAIDTTEFHSGGRSLFVEFDGRGGGEAGVYQLVPVKPNTHYEFLGYLRSEAIESASGPRFVLEDAYEGTSYAAMDEMLGTTSWRQHTAGFQTGPQTTLLLLKLARAPEQALIKGKVWVDDVQLRQR